MPISEGASTPCLAVDLRLGVRVARSDLCEAMAISALLSDFGWVKVAVQLAIVYLVYRAIPKLYRLFVPEQRPGEPPIVRSSVPWLGSLVAFSKDPNAFVVATRRVMGDAFTAIVAGQRIVFLSDYRCFPEVFRRTRDLSFELLKRKSVIPGFGKGDFVSVLDAYPDIDIDLMRYLKGDELNELIARYHDALRAVLNLPPLPGSELTFYEDKSEERVAEMNWQNWPGEGREWHTVDLLALLKVNTATNCDVFLGPGIATKQFQDDLMKFSDGFPVLCQGLPEWLPIPEMQDIIAARQRLFNSSCVRTHTVKTHGILLSRREILIERVGNDKYKTFADIGLLFGSIVNTNQAIFWLLTHLLKEKEGLAAVRAELDGVLGENKPLSVDPTELSHQLKSLVLLDAVVSETLRLHSVGFAPRIIANDTEIAFAGKKVRVRKDDLLMVSSTALHRNTDIFGADADEFRWDRFINDDRTGPRRFVDVKTGHMVVHPIVTFGGGSSLCPGRQYAREEMKMSVATMLRHYDIELESEDQAIPAMKPVPLNVSMPADGAKFMVKIKRHDLTE